MNEVITRNTEYKPMPNEVVSWTRVLKQYIDSSVYHFYYPIKDVREEIHKRSSYIGKFRSTEQAAHLLDLIAMTGDEEDIFRSFLDAAAADVFDSLVKYANAAEEVYSVGEDPLEEVEEGESKKTDNVNYYLLRYDTLAPSMVKPLDTAILEALVNRVIYKWLVLSYPSEAETYLTLYAEAEENIKTRAARRRSSISEIAPRPY